VPHNQKPITSNLNHILTVQGNHLTVQQIAMVVLSLFIIYVIPAYSFPLVDMDEGAYAAVSREMFINGHWWTTVLNGEPFFHKPALMYWTQSLGLFLFGEGRFAYRFPSLLAFFIWLYVSYQFVKQYFGVNSAWTFLWISILSVGSIISFKAAIPDAWLILFISLGIYKSYEYVATENPTPLIWAFVWTGFGVLAKGPIAFVVVGGTLFFYLVMAKNWALLLKTFISWKGWLAIMVVVLPWYLLQVYLYGQQFLDEFFGVHNVGRFMNTMEDHGGSVFYYVLDLFLLSLPFISVLTLALLPWLRDSKAATIERMMLIWFLLVLIFFTIAATKLPHYLMYGMPPVLIMMAVYFQTQQPKWGLGMALIVFAGLLIFLPQGVEQASSEQKDLFYQEMLKQASLYLPDGYVIWVGLMMISGLVLLFVNWHKMLKLVLAGMVSALSFNYAMILYAMNLQQEPIVAAANYVKENNLEVVTCCITMPSFNVEAQQITPTRMPNEGEVVFGKRYELEKKFTKVEFLWVERGVAIAKIIEE